MSFCVAASLHFSLNVVTPHKGFQDTVCSEVTTDEQWPGAYRHFNSTVFVQNETWMQLRVHRVGNAKKKP